MASIIELELCGISPSGSEAQIRRHVVPIDRPVEKGGADLGPMGGELFLAAVGGCFMSNLQAAIRAREADIGNLRTRVAGTLGESPARFTAIELTVSGNGKDTALLAKLVDIASRGCITLNTLRGTVEMAVRIS